MAASHLRFPKPTQPSFEWFLVTLGPGFAFVWRFKNCCGLSLPPFPRRAGRIEVPPVTWFLILPSPPDGHGATYPSIHPECHF
jgi:hypothetical protein